MRLLPVPSSLLPTIALVLSASQVILANPVYKLVKHNVILAERQCASYCGSEGQYCCASNEVCTTFAGNAGPVATCLAGSAATAGPGEWMTFTTTWVETNLVTRTSVYSSFVGGSPPQATQTQGCSISCGNSCCGGGETCVNPGTGQCAPIASASATTTVPFESAVPTGTNIPVGDGGDGGGGLSGGAIAGIVIGVLAGIILLILLCLFCCARTLFHSVLAIFGIGRKKHVREETYIESHHSHGGAAAGGRRWYGNQGPARPQKEKKSGWSKAGGAAAALGGLALALGLKRKHDRKNEAKSDYTSSYTYSDYTSSSSASSSDRRTRDTRRSSRR